MNAPDEPVLDRDLARRIRLIVMDCDGVLTDGRVRYLSTGEEIHAFHVRDGSGLKYWARAGGRSAIISGRGSPALLRRAGELGVHAVRMHVKRKIPAYREVLERLDAAPETTAVIGDDLTDLPMLWNCVLPIAVADAVDEVRAAAAMTTRTPGGCGAVREAVERICRAAGTWDALLNRYRRDAGEATA